MAAAATRRRTCLSQFMRRLTEKRALARPGVACIASTDDGRTRRRRGRRASLSARLLIRQSATWLSETLRGRGICGPSYFHKARQIL